MPANKKGYRREVEFLEKLSREGYIAHRIAGSGLKDSAICDLIAVKNGKPFFVEVKSKKKTFYSRAHLPQLEALKNAAKSCKAVPLLAVKINYKDWQIFDLRKGIPKKVE